MTTTKHLSIKEVAHRLNVHEQTIYRLARTTEFPARRVGRLYRIAEDELQAWLHRERRQ
jgi:excisionase family DNA binding protein